MTMKLIYRGGSFHIGKLSINVGVKSGKCYNEEAYYVTDNETKNESAPD